MKIQKFIIEKNTEIQLIVNSMRTASWLVKMSILAFIEPMKQDLRKMFSYVSLWCNIFKDLYMNKWTFHDVHQSEMVLEGQ